MKTVRKVTLPGMYVLKVSSTCYDWACDECGSTIDTTTSFTLKQACRDALRHYRTSHMKVSS